MADFDPKRTFLCAVYTPRLVPDPYVPRELRQMLKEQDGLRRSAGAVS
jgi:hypothetical protein